MYICIYLLLHLSFSSLPFPSAALGLRYASFFKLSKSLYSQYCTTLHFILPKSYFLLLTSHSTLNSSHFPFHASKLCESYNNSLYLPCPHPLRILVIYFIFLHYKPHFYNINILGSVSWFLRKL